MQLITHLNFNGNCEAAFNFYAQVLGGKITFMMKLGDSPMADKTPAEMKDKIMHAALEVPNGGILMGADHPQGKTVAAAGFCVSAQVDQVAQADQIFKQLSENGQVQMALQKTFWSPAFGMCIDKFGIPWMVNCAGAM
jgi:PhnB protein